MEGVATQRRLRVEGVSAYGIILLFALASMAQCSRAQAFRVAVLKPRPRLLDTLTVGANPATVNFTLVPKGTATGSASVTVTTLATGINMLSSLTLYGYFISSASALSGSIPVVNIPSSCVLGQMPTGTATTFTAFTQTGPFGGAGASLLLFTESTGVLLGTLRTDTLNLEINLSSVPQLPSATYTGTLTLQAQAF